MPYTKKSKEFTNVKRKIQLILCASLLFFSLIIAYFGGFNNYNNHRRLQEIQDLNGIETPAPTEDVPGEIPYPEDSGSDQGNIVEDEHLYPPNLFTDQQIAQWAWILHFVGMFYMFLGISIVCDDYFVPTLETIVEKLDMSDDTAGATWLAAGGSAPELFTSFIGIFIAKSDVGFGTIVGSAVFNVLFVVGMCAFFTPGDLPLTWWPFARDLSYYIICLGLLSLFFGGTTPGYIDWWESLTLFLFYVLYVIIMSYNQSIKEWFFAKFVDEKESLLKKYQNKTELVQKEMVKENSFSGVSQGQPSNYSSLKTDVIIPTDEIHSNDNDKQDNDGNGSDDDDSEEEGPDLSWPSAEDGIFARIMFLMKYPIMLCCYLTLPDVTKEQSKKYWWFTFFGALLWLGCFSYFMVWWAVVVGHVWGVPDEIMGLTFLAAGTSVPELFSCILVARKGKADMAVSGSIGSNIFDVLVGLSLPWFFYSVISGGGTVRVEADRLFLSIILLVLILITLTIAIIYNRWTLTHKLGFVMFLLWVFFVTQDLLRHFLNLDQKWFGSSLIA